jgi:predicted O-methyltransferase YrrM
MYGKLTLAFKYFSFFLHSSGKKGHGIHSPFVFDLIRNVLNDQQHYPDYDQVEALRSRMIADKRMITVEDFGAGSSGAKKNTRSISSIARRAAKPQKYGQLLYRFAQYFKPENIIELGTSLGITTAYLAKGNPGAKLITMEGAEEIAVIARANFGSLPIANCQLSFGNFDKTLENVLKGMQSVDLAYIDGNHRLEPTKNYFHQLLAKANDQSIFIFDDIHWSREMETAWDYIKKHPAVKCSIDLFFLGIVLFRKEFAEKQEFKIRC